jgi:hypothetical protein
MRRNPDIGPFLDRSCHVSWFEGLGGFIPILFKRLLPVKQQVYFLTGVLFDAMNLDGGDACGQSMISSIGNS